MCHILTTYYSNNLNLTQLITAPARLNTNNYIVALVMAACMDAAAPPGINDSESFGCPTYPRLSVFKMYASTGSYWSQPTAGGGSGNGANVNKREERELGSMLG